MPVGPDASAELPRRARQSVPDPLTGGETAGRKRDARLAARRHRRPTPSATTGSPAAPRSSRPTCTSAASRARELEERAGRHDAYTRQLAWRDFYAHVLLHNPGNARHAYRSELDAIEWDGDRRALRRLARGPHRLSARRRGHAPARPDRLDAQPRAADHRLLPGQGPAHRLAPRRAALHALPARRRRRPEQRQLAVDRLASASTPRRCTGASTTRCSSRSATTRTATYVRRWVPELAACRWPSSPRRGRRVTRTPIVDHAVERRRTLEAYAAARTVSCPRIATFTLEPRGPFTLASAARFIAGWPPGQAATRRRRASAALPRRRLERPAARRAHPGRRRRRPRDGRGRATRSARSRRPRGSSRSTTTAPATREVGERDPIVGELQRRQRLPAPRAVPLALRGRGLVGHLRAHRPRPGGEAARRALRRRRLPGARASCCSSSDAARACPRSKVPRLHGIAEAALEGKLDREPLLAADPDEAYTRAAGAAGHRPVLRRPDPAARRRHRPTSRPRASRGSSKAVQARYGRPLADVAERWRPFRTWVSVLMQGQRMTEQLYVQRDQPPGVPPLHLTGERTLPDVPEENYWYRRHLVVYEWIAAARPRPPGRRPRVRRGLRLRRAGAHRASR